MQEVLNTLYVTTEHAYLRLDHDTLRMEVEKETAFRMPLLHLRSIVCFGNILLSPGLMHRCSEEGRSILLLDQAGRFNLSSFDDYQSYVKSLVSQSFIGGNVLASFTASPCQKLDIKPPMSQFFEGPVAANKTSNPMLFMGNVRDPITPLASAKKMSSQFPGSSVLTMNGTAVSSQ